MTIRRFAPRFNFRFTRRRLLVAIILLILLLGGLILYANGPVKQLDAARALWASQNMSAYRIVVEYKIPLYECQQDFEVHGELITYHYKDECQVSPVVGFNSPLSEPLIVSNLFRRVEDGLKQPACGQNGCACDGPVGIDVIYEPERGYPRQINYRLMPELRWRYLEYWQAQLSGSPTCPTSGKNTLPDTGQTITVISLTPLKPEASIGTLPLGTPTAGK